MHPVVGFQLVLQAEFLPAAVTFVGLLPGVDAFVALQRVLVSEAAPAELALVRMVACWKVGERRTLSVPLLAADASASSKTKADCFTLQLLCFDASTVNYLRICTRADVVQRANSG